MINILTGDLVTIVEAFSSEAGISTSWISISSPTTTWKDITRDVICFIDGEAINLINGDNLLFSSTGITTNWNINIIPITLWS